MVGIVNKKYNLNETSFTVAVFFDKKYGNITSFQNTWREDPSDLAGIARIDLL